jgi:protein transport protein SEC24
MSQLSVRPLLLENLQLADLLLSTACLPRYTSGQTYFYPGFNAARPEDALKFARELGGIIAMPVMLEAVMRVRASRGLRSTSYFGNFFVMKTDLLAMPAVPQDQSYVVELEIEETLTQPYVVFQTAIMHTTCFGERRIRVITTAVPTTTSLSEIFAGADEIALAALYANKAVERSLSHKLEDARDSLVNKTVEIMNAYKASMTAGGAAASSQLAIADNLRMFPVLMLAILKSVAIRQSGQIPPDLRAYAQALLTSLPTERLIPYLYPTFYSLHNMPPEVRFFLYGGFDVFRLPVYRLA